MKKFLPFMMIAFIGLFMLSCDTRDEIINNPDSDTFSVVIDIKNVNFQNTGSGYFISRTFQNTLYDSDVVLIYRQDGTTSNGSPVWQLIPRTLYLTQGELDYDFDFSRNDIMIYADGNYALSTTPEYVMSQTFRVVLVPASQGGKNANVDYSDYNSVIRYFKIDDTKVKTL